ncbi:hypothetical protein J6590_091650, partial [Homalodisca vitripennis]
DTRSVRQTSNYKEGRATQTQDIIKGSGNQRVGSDVTPLVSTKEAAVALKWTCIIQYSN